MPARTLQQCLEQVAALGPGYLLTDHQGMKWSATGVIASLTRENPDRLALQAYLRLPDTQLEGAVYQATQSGGFIRWYRIHRSPV
jgi:hypothetical protein